MNLTWRIANIPNSQLVLACSGSCRDGDMPLALLIVSLYPVQVDVGFMTAPCVHVHRSSPPRFSPSPTATWLLVWLGNVNVAPRRFSFSFWTLASGLCLLQVFRPWSLLLKSGPSGINILLYLHPSVSSWSRDTCDFCLPVVVVVVNLPLSPYFVAYHLLGLMNIPAPVHD